MPINEDLLQILCCPRTKVPVEMLPPEQLAKLNEQIATGTVKYADGSAVEKPLPEDRPVGEWLVELPDDVADANAGRPGFGGGDLPDQRVLPWRIFDGQHFDAFRIGQAA